MVGAFECNDLDGLIVLAESLVVVDMGVFPRAASWSGDVSGRPLGTSSETRAPSVEGRLGSGDGCWAGRDTSMLSLLGSKEGRVNPSAPDELDGLVGGDGGGCPLGKFGGC